MRLVLILTLACSGSLFAQWNHIPLNLPTETPLPSYWERGSGLMSGNGIGYWSQSMYFSPSSGSTYRVHYTDCDWGANAIAINGGSGTGCCSVALIDVIEPHTLFYTHNNQGNLSLRSATRTEAGYDYFTYPNAPGYIGSVSAIDDTTCMAICGYSTARLLTRRTPHTIDIDTLAFDDWVTELAYYNIDIGACIVDLDSSRQEVWVTTNAGEEWNLAVADSGHALRDAKWLDAQTLWLVGNTGYVLRSANSGVDWDQVDFPASANLYSVVGYSSDSVWIGGADGTIQVTGDAGTTWSDLAFGDSLIFRLQAYEGAVYAYEVYDYDDNDAYTRLHRFGPLNVSVSELSAQQPLELSWSLTPNGILLHLHQDLAIKRVLVTDAIGRVVNVRVNGTEVEMRYLSSGTYFVRWENNSHSGMNKVAWVRP